MDERLHIYDTVAFIHDFLLDKLDIHKIDRTIMLHVTCSAVKMGLTQDFTVPELNESALRHLNEAIPDDCEYGYSNSRTCEIGLSAKSGFSYQSIAYLVDECSRPQA